MTVLLLRVVLAMGCAMAGPAATSAQQRVVPADGPVHRVVVTLNKSESYRLDSAYADILVGSSEIADVIPLSDRQIYILGKKVGTTNVTLYDKSKRLLNVIDVEVKLDTMSVEGKIRNSTGSRNIRVGDVNGKLVLSGTAEDAQSVDRAVSVAESLSPSGVVNALNVGSTQQVMLKVRFVEASRDATRALGVRWDLFRTNGRLLANVGKIATTSVGGSPFAEIVSRVIAGNNTKLDVVLTALEDQGVIRRLAEPNLVATSGQTAEFLAGGEFPVPVSASTTNGFPTTTIQFKEFGVGLGFTPTVLAGGVINLRLEPSVSELDYSNGVTLQGVQIPGLIKRRTRTTVELRDGQSFAISGLLQAQSARTVEQVPWLGQVPVLGTLFRSPSFQQKETELVVIVTPYLVKPVPPGKQLKTPLDTTLAGNDIDFFLNAQAEIPKSKNGLISGAGVDAGPVGGIPSAAPDPDPGRMVR